MENLKISMCKDETHHVFKTSATGDTKFCGYTHCRGDCGSPALILQYAGPETGNVLWEFKGHGSMVAHGPVWQRRTWTGERVVLDAVYSTPKIFDMWWM